MEAPGNVHIIRDAQFDARDGASAGDAGDFAELSATNLRTAQAARPRIRLTGLLALLASRRAARPASGTAVLIDDDTQEVLP